MSEDRYTLFVEPTEFVDECVMHLHRDDCEVIARGTVLQTESRADGTVEVTISVDKLVLRKTERVERLVKKL